MPAMRSSTRPSRPDCTSITPAIMITRAAALKKVICHDSPEMRRRGVFAIPSSRDAVRPLSAFPVAVADTIERLNGIEIIIDDLEFLAQAFDVAVDGAVVHVDLIVVCRVHEIVAALYEAGPLGETLQDQEFGDRQPYRFAVPRTLVPLRI